MKNATNTTNTKKVKTPERILDSAEELMLREGYHGVSVDTIIEQSGISKGTFFYHFKTKDVLAARLLQRFFKRQGDIIRVMIHDAEAQGQPPLDTLLIFLDIFGSQSSSSGCLLASFSYQLIDEIPEIQAICQQALEGWEVLFRPYFARALNIDDDDHRLPRELSRQLFCLMEGAFIVRRIDASRELKTQAEHFARYIKLLAAGDKPE